MITHDQIAKAKRDGKRRQREARIKGFKWSKQDQF